MGAKTHKKYSGFTVIEVMLFLAITGMLTVGILVGAGLSIGQQRYRDSVNSLKSFLQGQYSEAANVVNDRTSGWTCNPSAAITENPGGGEPRGTSDCTMLGRFITIADNGTSITASNVVGYRTTLGPTAASDILELKDNYQLGVAPINQEESEVSWGAQIVKPKTATPSPLSILIIRSPLSGSIMTFSAEGVTTDPNTLITEDNLKTERNLCVNADAGTFVGQRLAVQISAFASSQGAILVPQESANICD